MGRNFPRETFCAQNVWGRTIPALDAKNLKTGASSARPKATNQEKKTAPLPLLNHKREYAQSMDTRIH